MYPPYLSLDFDGVVLLLDALQDLGLLFNEGVRAVEEAAVVERQEPGVVLFEPGKTRPGWSWNEPGLGLEGPGRIFGSQ